MTAILHNRSTEATLSTYIFYVIVVRQLYVCALNGLLSHNLYQHGVFSMNILDILRARIKESFPEISHDELELRVNYAYELIKHIRK